jgi:hypothetical protein
VRGGVGVEGEGRGEKDRKGIMREAEEKWMIKKKKKKKKNMGRS